jgi:environmental stress-induced protein Ves
MRVIRAADCRHMPWKNGGGQTIEIAVSPEGAGLDDFDWRLSRARVESDGPFSLFPGVDRTLAVLEGEGILLGVEGRIPFGLTRDSEPFSFPADVPTHAALISGPITDLNLMTRRGKAVHSMHRLAVRADSNIAIEADEFLLFCLSGAVRICDNDALRLGPLDTLHASDVRQALRVSVDDEPADLFVIEIAKTA